MPTVDNSTARPLRSKPLSTDHFLYRQYSSREMLHNQPHSTKRDLALAVVDVVVSEGRLSLLGIF